MEEQKYYTPAPEDIRPGFEFEQHTSDMIVGSWVKQRVDVDDTEDMSFWLWRFKHRLQEQRVPYLTAEQIEAEGWKANSDQRDYVLGDKDEEHYTLHHSVAFNEVIINRISYNEETNSMRKQLIYFGKCRCINDFRLICKLLGI